MKNQTTDMFSAFDPATLSQSPERSSLWFVDNWQNLQELVQIVDRRVVPHLDFENAVRQDTTFISDTLEKKVSDLLYAVPIREGSEPESERETLPVYVMVEHQSTVDPIMALRLHAYMLQIWGRDLGDHLQKPLPAGQWDLPVVIGIVFYTGDRRWSVPLSLRELSKRADPFNVYVPDNQLLLLDVKHTDAETLTGPDHPFGWGLTVLQQEHESQESLRSAIVRATEHLLSLGPDQAHQRDKCLSYIYMLIYGRRPREEHSDLVDAVHDLIKDKSLREKEESKVQTIAQSLFAEGMEAGEKRGEKRGIEIGEQRGEQRGVVRAKREAILKLLYSRFDNVPDTLTRKIQRMRSLERLDAVFTQALEAKTVQDIEA